MARESAVFCVANGSFVITCFIRMTIFTTVANIFTPAIIDRIARNVDEPVDRTQRAVEIHRRVS